uniref:Dolichol phosphate-mannose biosynthesis regulatory protein n=1 Tax=Rhizophora mucronata TaxID=61149 RepID=A0A2P2INP4_RHIMU
MLSTICRNFTLVHILTILFQGDYSVMLNNKVSITFLNKICLFHGHFPYNWFIDSEQCIFV